MTARDAALAGMVIVIWAFNFIVAKVGVGELPPLLLVSFRFALVAVLLAPFLKRPGRHWRTIVAVGFVLGSCHFGLMFTGLRGVDAGPAAIAIQLTVPFSAALAWFAYGERLSRLQWLGMVIAFAGVYVLAGEPSRTPSLPHFLLVVAGAFAWAVANILIKRLGSISVFTLNAWVAIIASPTLFLTSLLLESGQREAVLAADWRGWGAVVYTALAASITAYGAWYYLIGRYPVGKVVPLTLLSPVLAVAFAALFLEEPMTLRILLGGAVTLAGVAMIQFLPSRRATQEAEA